MLSPLTSGWSNVHGKFINTFASYSLLMQMGIVVQEPRFKMLVCTWVASGIANEKLCSKERQYVEVAKARGTCVSLYTFGYRHVYVFVLKEVNVFFSRRRG